jgi:hypothetical protein
VTCSSCYRQWFICINCPCGTGDRLLKKILKGHEKSATHRRNTADPHVDSTRNKTEEFQVTDDVHMEDEVDEPETDSHSSIVKDLGHTTRPSEFKFQYSRSSNYFRHHAKNKNGPSYLVSKAIFGSLQGGCVSHPDHDLFADSHDKPARNVCFHHGVFSYFE